MEYGAWKRVTHKERGTEHPGRGPARVGLGSISPGWRHSLHLACKVVRRSGRQPCHYAPSRMRLSPLHLSRGIFAPKLAPHDQPQELGTMRGAQECLTGAARRRRGKANSRNRAGAMGRRGVEAGQGYKASWGLGAGRGHKVDETLQQQVEGTGARRGCSDQF